MRVYDVNSGKAQAEFVVWINVAKPERASSASGV
jgi:hypothetical protein